ncbi:MAG: hypothetical protein ACRCSP_06450 [Rhodoglobus sp.]
MEELEAEEELPQDRREVTGETGTGVDTLPVSSRAPPVGSTL